MRAMLPSFSIFIDRPPVNEDRESIRFARAVVNQQEHGPCPFGWEAVAASVCARDQKKTSRNHLCFLALIVQLFSFHERSDGCEEQKTLSRLKKRATIIVSHLSLVHSHETFSTMVRCGSSEHHK